MHMSASLSVDEILLLKYMNWSTNFRGLQFNEEMALLCIVVQSYSITDTVKARKVSRFLYFFFI